MKLKPIIFALLIIFFFGNVDKGLANELELCYLLGRVDEVFVGEISQTTSTDIIFNVSEGLIGVKKNEKYSIRKSISDCFNFQRGKFYLIFARGDISVYENNIKIPVKDCVQAKELKDSAKDLQILRNLISQSKGATISGNLYQSTTAGRLFKSEKYLSDTKVRISKVENNEVIAETSTNKYGNYQFKDISIGNYQISPVLPNWLEPHYSNSQNLLIKKNVGCLNKSFFIENKSELRGKIIDENNNPVKDFTIELIQLDIYLQPMFDQKLTKKTIKNAITQNGFTNDKGEFSFYNMPEGKYVLAINYKYAPNSDEPFPRTFYPNSSLLSKAKIFEIGKATKLDTIVFKLPNELEKIEIKGRVLGVTTLPENIEVSINDLETNQSFEGEIDQQGNFKVIGFKGRKYRIMARSSWTSDTLSSSSESYYASTPIFILGNKSLFYTLNLRNLESKLRK